MNFTIYDLTTNMIKRSGSCPEDMYDLQVQENEGILPIVPDITHNKVDPIEGITYYQEDVLPIERIQELKARRIRSTGSRKLEDLAYPYSQQERETWTTQFNEANTYLKDNTANVPLISQMATNRNIPISLMVDKIVESANLYRAGSGIILGEQQRLLDMVYSATTKEEIDAIEWA